MTLCENCRENEATTTYQDKARKLWRLCVECRAKAKRRRA